MRIGTWNLAGRWTDDELGLQVPTALVPHALDGLLSIDHVALTQSLVVVDCEHHEAASGPRRLSDHDAYVVQGQTGGSTQGRP